MKRQMSRLRELPISSRSTMRSTISRRATRKSKVVELKFFGGLEAAQIAELLQVSEKTVLRDWGFAKLWLCRELNASFEGLDRSPATLQSAV